jgi:hypothetical protein
VGDVGVRSLPRPSPHAPPAAIMAIMAAPRDEVAKGQYQYLSFSHV